MTNEKLENTLREGNEEGYSPGCGRLALGTTAGITAGVVTFHTVRNLVDSRLESEGYSVWRNKECEGYQDNRTCFREVLVQPIHGVDQKISEDSAYLKYDLGMAGVGVSAVLMAYLTGSLMAVGVKNTGRSIKNLFRKEAPK